ncbi:uncharacterized protein LOC129569513 isoform X2 [Sitodiplosis mosellana]|uniref:uncharacterized protein LOC129569513 isoform X2 n=1 Tax=Sitodiplosis mosellana TaxID=263140 RepID=UPI002443B774|nr:uncharacterized protein LOC129569513 isoform X2 [Sitodiplosis mosellana]
MSIIYIWVLMFPSDPDVVQHGIPHIIHFGDFGGFKVLVMTKTGPNLYDLAYETDDEKFTFSTICKIAIQSIRIFEYIHSKGLLFHDVKPTNIAVGRTNADQIFFYDFAFSEFYVNAMGEPKAREKATELNGTPEYMGRGPLNRNTHVRKDDFISFGLVLLHLNGVRLPWMNLTNEFEDIYQTMDIVLEQWAKYGIYAICNESDSPNFFVKYFDYFDTLKSHERPDYDFLVQLFENELTAEELANKNWNDCEIKHTNDTDNFEKFDSDDNNKETSLTVVNELKWTIPEKYIHGVVIDDRFIVGKHLGHGYTGFVRSGLDTKTGTEVAIKFAAEDKFHYLENEFVNYLYLGADDPDIVQHGVPYIVHFGDFLDYKILVMTKAGPSLFELRNRTKAGKIELKWLCKIAIQAIRILQFIHSKGLIFHDVKPQNIVVSDANENQILFIDFAFSKFYRNAMGEPEPRKATDWYSGTPGYMARKPLNRYTQVRKDDFISLGITLLVLNGVFVPWMDEINSGDDFVVKMDTALAGWEKYGIKRPIDNSDSPKLFSKYFDYFDTIQSHEEPDYDGLVELFTSELKSILEKEPDYDVSKGYNLHTSVFKE